MRFNAGKIETICKKLKWILFVLKIVPEPELKSEHFLCKSLKPEF